MWSRRVRSRPFTCHNYVDINLICQADWRIAMLNKPIIPHAVVSREEWLAARRALLAREKEATRLRDEVNGERLALPWVRVEKNYVFDTPAGKKPLAGLFETRS